MALLSPEEAAWKLYSAAQKGAPSRNKVFDLRYHDVLELMKEGKCAVTGVPFDMNERQFKGPELPWRASLDRIDNRIGYLPNNIQITAKIYNVAKYTWTDEEVLKLARALVNKHGG